MADDILIFSSEIMEYLSKSYITPTEGDALCTMLRTPPLFTTLRVNTDVVTLDRALETVSSDLNEQYENRNVERPNIYVHPMLKDLIVIDNRGPQIVKQVKMKVIVEMTCGEAVLRGADVFARGVIATPSYMKVGDVVSVYADVEGACLRGYQKSYHGTTVFVGNGVACLDRTTLFGGLHSDKLRGLAIEMTAPLYVGPSLQSLHSLGTSLFAQNLPSVVCGHVMDVREGQLIVDMCAAPGGKTGHLASLIKNQGRIIAVDKSKNRVKRMKETLAKLKASCVEAYPFDSVKLIQDGADLSGSPPYPMESFDRVLVDAPCSALGQRPSLKNSIRLCEITSFPKIQAHLLDVAVKAVTPGGYIVYSTCSIPVEENENQVHRLLVRYPELELVAQPHIGGKGRENSDLSAANCALVQYFTGRGATVDQDTICFFVAKFKKTRTLINKS